VRIFTLLFIVLVSLEIKVGEYFMNSIKGTHSRKKMKLRKDALVPESWNDEQSSSKSGAWVRVPV